MNFVDAFSWVNIRFLLDGLLVTVEVAVLSIIFSFIIGSVLGLIRYLKIPVVSKIVGLLIDLIRNLPLLLIIFFTYFALPQIGIRLDIFWSAIVAMTIFESSMLSEIIRAGLNSVPKGQTEAGLSTGLTQNETMRYIVLPQAFKIVIPPLGNQFINLVKNSSVLAMVTGLDLMYQGDLIASETFNTFDTYILIGAIYLIITLPLTYLMGYIERRLNVTS